MVYYSENGCTGNSFEWVMVDIGKCTSDKEHNFSYAAIYNSLNP